MDAGTIATFDPSTDADSFRGALGTFVTGVTVVTTDSIEGPVAIVANRVHLLQILQAHFRHFPLMPSRNLWDLERFCRLCRSYIESTAPSASFSRPPSSTFWCGRGGRLNAHAGGWQRGCHALNCDSKPTRLKFLTS